MRSRTVEYPGILNVVQTYIEGMHFDDTLVLLKTDGQWRIVSKVFYLRAS